MDTLMLEDAIEVMDEHKCNTVTINISEALYM